MYRSTEAGMGGEGIQKAKRETGHRLSVSGMANDITAECKNIKARQGTIINQFVPINQTT